MRHAPWSALAVLAAVSCAAAVAPQPAPVPAPPFAAPPVLGTPNAQPAETGVVLPEHPTLRATLRAPASVPYDPLSLGDGGQLVEIRLENRGPRPVAVDHARFTFEASRDRVPFACNQHHGAASGAHEPSRLEPGEAFTFERELDCVLPLPGRYDVGVLVSFGDEGSPRGPLVDRAGSFVVDLVEQGGPVPRPHPTRQGLYVLMTGGSRTRPMQKEAWARGDYGVVLAFINGTAHPLPLGPATIAFRVSEGSTPLACSGAAVPLTLPALLPPGGMEVVRAPVPCAPPASGGYEIAGDLAFTGDATSVELGRIPLQVTREPTPIAPLPFPSSRPFSP